MAQINSLPDVRAAGIKSPEYEEARRTHTRILRKAYEVENELESLMAKLSKLNRDDQQALAQAWLAGEDDVPEDESLGELREEISALKRRRQTLTEVAIPEAEGQVLNTIAYHRQEWAKQIVREELPVRIRELREVLPQVQQLIAPKVYRLLSAVQILDWCESGSPGVYSPPQDTITPAAVRQVEEVLAHLESKLSERDDVELEDAPLEEVSA